MAREYLGQCPAAPMSEELDEGRNGMRQIVDSEAKGSFIITLRTLLVRVQAELEQ